jgi:hypothetical protein
MSKTSRDEDLVHNLLFDIVAISCFIGPCLNKYVQTSQENVNVHTYPSGNTVVKAFVANNIIFYSKKQRIIRDLNKASLNKAALVKITWGIQTNCQNNQTITLAANMANPAICPMCSAMQMVLKACWLHQPNYMPVVIYKMKKNKIFWLSGNKIDELLRKAVQMICSDTTPDHLNRYSAHLLHVWACVFAIQSWEVP